MGGLVGGIFDLVSGDPTKKEEGQLGDLSTFTSNTGQGDINAANSYYSGILSGDPAQIAKTLAPEIKAGSDELEQQRKTTAEFGNRAGGNNAATQAGESQERGNIINLIGGLQQGAAGAEANLGTNLLSQATGNINSEADLALKNRQRKTSDVGGIAADVASIAGGFFGGGAAPEFSGANQIGGLADVAANPVQPISLDTFNPYYSADQYPTGV